MRKTREVLRLKWALKRSHREIWRSTGVGVGTVSDCASRATAAGLDWAGVERLTDEELEAKLYPPAAAESRPLPEPLHLHLELKRAGVTLRLLHVEYLESHPDGYGYTQFCRHYHEWLQRRRLTMRQTHRAGDKLFVDYAGKTPHLIDPKTGAPIEVELFLAVLGASNFTFAEATLTQQSHDWIGSHVRAFDFLGGVTAAVVPDQLKTGVTRACRYEPGIQRVYEELGQHYDTAILPARPGHPRDKAKVEVGVQIAERWILARLRNQTFFSLDALNQRIGELLDDLNDRVMRRYKESRRQLFERLDRPALKPLPAARFSFGTWLKAKVNIDYHIVVDDHFYSAHYLLVHEDVDARYTATTVEIFLHNRRIASHARSFVKNGFTTLTEHMPAAHQKQAEWTSARLSRWAASAGPHARALVEAIMAERRHPQWGFRSCLGIMRLGEKYGADRLEAACRRALVAHARSYTHVASILKTGLDRAALPAPVVEGAAAPALPSTPHENIRGRTYYNN